MVSLNPPNCNDAILVDVELDSSGARSSAVTDHAAVAAVRPRTMISDEDLILVAAAQDFPRTYQNQTAEDIESGRSRMDSVTSFR